MVDIDPSDVGQSLPKGSVVRHSKTRVSMTATVNVKADKLGRGLGDALWLPFRPAIGDCDGAALDPSERT
jgi:hypothetical protein